MPAATIDTIGLTEQINTKIDTIKTSPGSYFMSMWSGRQLSNGSKSEISSLLWLKNLLLFTAGNTVRDPLDVTLSPDSPDDRTWFVDGIDIYLAQANAGMACLLSDYIDTLKACRERLTQAA